MEFCPHCMVEHRATGPYCLHCGKNISWKANPGQLPLGTVLKGKDGVYHLGAVRGQGGFGITYAALNLRNAKRVAIKEYYPVRCANRTASNQVVSVPEKSEEFLHGKKAFMEEAMMLSVVNALNSIVSVQECFEANGTAYLVMEFVDGQPLFKIVQKKGRITSGELIPVLPELFRDLQILHKYGIIHRDISPDNLVLMPNGKIKLLDFGSARNTQLDKDLSVLVKPGFSPVEQYQSRGQGAWTDIYALAATIYYCLTGIVPPAATDRREHDKMLRPNAAGAGLTFQQEQALMRAMAVDVSNRYQSMEDFQRGIFPVSMKGYFR